MNEDFRSWWMSGGSRQWSEALDAEGGTLKALEMVFKAGADFEHRPQVGIDKVGGEQ